jgi:hypothetical protein
METLKKIWHSPLGKLSISFTGLIILIFTLTVTPLIIYFSGEDVPVIIYNAHREDPRFEDMRFVEVGIKDFTFVSLDVFSDEIRDTYDIDQDALSRRFFEGDFYAIIEVSANQAFVKEVVDKTPTDGIYLKIDYLYLSIDPVLTDENFEETGVYTPIYDGVQIVYPNLINILFNQIPDLNDRLLSEEIPLTLRIHNGNFIIINP